MEDFFDYRWKYDMNQSIDDEKEKAILDQLPIETQDRLFAKFLFKDFLIAFRGFFRIEKNRCGILGQDFTMRSFFTWSDLQYREFMVSIL